MAHQPYRRIVPNSSTAVLFVHGIVGTPDQFRHLLPLVPPEWSVVNVLLPGHGSTVTAFARTSMAEWRSFIRSQVDTLAAEHTSILLVGHSMGTLLCISEALRCRDKVTGLFLLASPLRIRLHYSAVIQSLQVAFRLPVRTDAARSAQDACSIQTTPRLWEYLGWIPRYLELFAASRQGRRQVREISVPAVAVQSKDDEMVSPRSCRHLEALPHLQLHVLPHSRHFYYPPADLAALQSYFQSFITAHQH